MNGNDIAVMMCSRLDDKPWHDDTERSEAILDAFRDLSSELDDYARDVRADRGRPYAEGLADGIEFATVCIDKTVGELEQ